MPRYDKLPEKSILRKWEAIRDLDRIAIPLVPEMGLDRAYQYALQSPQCSLRSNMRESSGSGTKPASLSQHRAKSHHPNQLTFL